MDERLTARGIGGALQADPKRVMVDEFDHEAFPSRFIGVRVSRYSDDRWKGWRLPLDATTVPDETIGAMKDWLHG